MMWQRHRGNLFNISPAAIQQLFKQLISQFTCETMFRFIGSNSD